MTDKPTPSRSAESLSRERIVDAAIAILDAAGEPGLTFRALATQLQTGSGAIYWHVDDKADLIAASCDAVVARTLAVGAKGRTPATKLRAMALAMFEAMDAHPWMGSALARAPADMPVVRLLEQIGRQIEALGVPPKQRWSTANALLSFIVGVGGQNAANAQFSKTHDIDRIAFLSDTAVRWAALDERDYPFVRGMASTLAGHDDRADFLAGVDVILRGAAATSK